MSQKPNYADRIQYELLNELDMIEKQLALYGGGVLEEAPVALERPWRERHAGSIQAAVVIVVIALVFGLFFMALLVP